MAKGTADGAAAAAADSEALSAPGGGEGRAGEDSPAVVEAREAAEAAGLRYVSDASPGITREPGPSGEGFAYRRPNGKPVEDEATLARVRALAIPPAYREVWICPHADGHIQATGRDEKGRKQYRYHPRWHEVRDAAKYGHMLEFAQALPELRARVAADMARPGLPREKVLATVVHLLEATLIRVGNDDYAKQNGSFGLTTLRDRHVKVEEGGKGLRFRFKGKSGKQWDLRVQDRRVARIVKACQELPGQDLFAYRDADGTVHDVTSGDVNEYLREATGSAVTAKDFRTWTGTVLAALALREMERFDTKAAAKRNVKAAIERVAARLGNTPTVCRKCYVHPEVLDLYLEGGLALEIAEEAEEALRDDIARLRPEEAAVLALLTARLREGGAGGTGEEARKYAARASGAKPSPRKRAAAPGQPRARKSPAPKGAPRKAAA